MARRRNLSPSFFKNEALSDIAPLGRILFQGLWCFADRNGNLEYRPKLLKAEVLPYESSAGEVAEFLEQLASNLLISFYEVEGSKYIHITNFARYQSPHPEEKAIWPTPENSKADLFSVEEVGPEDYLTQEDTEPNCQQLASNLEESDQQSSNSNSNYISSIEESDMPSLPVKNTKPEKYSQQVTEIFDYWKTVLNHPRSLLDSKRQRLIVSRLKEGLTIERAKAAIDGCKASAWHMGQNDRQTVYDAIELIFRDMGHVEKFEAKLSGKSSPAFSQKTQSNLAAAQAFLARHGQALEDAA